MKTNPKIRTIHELAELARAYQAQGKRVVLCHGCFDLLHIGHIRHFQEARQCGDHLMVTLSPDRYVDKGPYRPTFKEAYRAEGVASLGVVDYVAVNEWPTAVETLKLIRPDVYVKGSDFKSSQADKTGKLQLEEEACAQVGARLHFTDDIIFSSTNLINRFFSHYSEEVKEYLHVFRSRYSLQQIEDILERMKGLRVLVVGDAIIDEYRYCHTLGVSSKSPTLSVLQDSTDIFAGGAMAIANHIANFAHSVELVTVVGDQDGHGNFIRENLQHSVTPTLHVRKGAPTITKIRYLDGYSSTKLLEVHIMDDSGLEDALDQALRDDLLSKMADFDIVVAADFGHGTISPGTRELLSDKAPFLAVNTQANSANGRMHTISSYRKADYVSLTEGELRLDARSPRGNLRNLACDTAAKLSCKLLAATTGKKGACVGTADGSFIQVPAFSQHVVDNIGAGDAFFAISSLAARLGECRELVAFMGNLAGSLAVQIIGNKKAVNKQNLQSFAVALLK
jgi:rfaE bifunctional protein kinase chain/domain/rfaE bifunctional protein nucleotidyltransferase chain/domain